MPRKGAPLIVANVARDIRQWAQDQGPGVEPEDCVVGAFMPHSEDVALLLCRNGSMFALRLMHKVVPRKYADEKKQTLHFNWNHILEIRNMGIGSFFTCDHTIHKEFGSRGHKRPWAGIDPYCMMHTIAVRVLHPQLVRDNPGEPGKWWSEWMLLQADMATTSPLRYEPLEPEDIIEDGVKMETVQDDKTMIVSFNKVFDNFWHALASFVHAAKHNLGDDCLLVLR